MNKMQAAMGKMNDREKAARNFQDSIHTALEKMAEMPSVGDGVVLRLKRPFLGYRCEGTVRYIGVVPEMGKGVWIGVDLLEGLGDHHGMGYFRSRGASITGPRHAMFIKGREIECVSNVTAKMKATGRYYGPLQPRQTGNKWWTTPFMDKLKKMDPGAAPGSNRAPFSSRI
jgi:hypothetical protein